MDSMNAIPMVAECMKRQPQASAYIEHQWYESSNQIVADTSDWEREYPLWIGDMARPLISVKVWEWKKGG